MIINQGNLSNFFRGLRTVFDPAFQGAPAAWMNYAMRTDSSAAEEEYGFLGAVPGLKELLGEVTVRNMALHNFTIRNREWEDTIGVKVKDLERDRFGIYTPLVQSMAQAAKQHPDQLLADLVVAAFGGNVVGLSGKCYDGKNFFDAGHIPPGADPKKGGRYTNLRHDALSVASYQDAKTKLKMRKNAEGRSLKIGRKLVLVVGPENEDLGNEILKADFIRQAGEGAAAGAVAAVSNVNKDTATLDVWPELGAAIEGAWMLMDQGFVFKPFIVQYEVEPRNYAVTNENDSHVVLKKEFIYQVYARYNAGFGMPELITGSDNSGAANPA